MQIVAVIRFPMSLSDDQIRRLASLARLAIDADEARALASRLSRVLALIDEMRAVDTTVVEPMSHALEQHFPAGQRLRADEVTEPDRREAYQAVAPAVQDGLYLVPKVIE